MTVRKQRATAISYAREVLHWAEEWALANDAYDAADNAGKSTAMGRIIDMEQRLLGAARARHASLAGQKAAQP